MQSVQWSCIHGQFDVNELVHSYTAAPSAARTLRNLVLIIDPLGFRLSFSPLHKACAPKLHDLLL